MLSDDPSDFSGRPMSSDLDFRFKVILLGDSSVGKSSIVRRLVDQTFNMKYDETPFFDTVNKKWYLNDGTSVLLQIFDTAGLDRFDSLSGSYFQGASGFVIIFDYLNKETFSNVKKWIRELRMKATVEEPTIVVLGNKKDVSGSKVKVSSKDVDELRAEE